MAIRTRFSRSFLFSNYSKSNFRNALGSRRNVQISRRACSKFQIPGYSLNVSRLSPNEVTSTIRANEYSQDFPTGPVKSYDTNQLASNNPIEDTRAEGKSLLSDAFLVGVFDGHAGAACAQVLAKRLFKYVAASLLSGEEISKLHTSLRDGGESRIIDYFNDRYEFVNELKSLYAQSFGKYVEDLASGQSTASIPNVPEALVTSFLRLDSDISREASTDLQGSKTLSVSMSGAVACVAVIQACHLHVATVGDCQAVVGIMTESKTWAAKKVSIEHNSDNMEEVERILSEHPPGEKTKIIERERLLGQLAPLRAFGDFRYKWSREELERLAVPRYGKTVIAPHYETPPYLTAKPDVMYHRITPKDKFLVIASDGLWDLLSPLQVVRMVGEHMSGRAALSPLRLPHNMKLKDINTILEQRKDGLNKVPVDRNGATHLIRNALGGSEYGGVEHSRISQLLSLPQDVVRLFRDDITITVVYFDSDYISHCPL
ncbi:Pyruvate dehydrogenase [Nesidiocoris tenuis]|uniref:Pyruvate dehydrogenase n=1 Tax=Nesidiocoris tenuis TaxID=355587 RepID=A0ABN7BE96_9HEMI|nr:Pyruvate dehydrogenase [Nesidiocoris tenuis]